MGVKGIDHWVIVSGDVGRTLGFYSALGLEIAWEQREGRPSMPTVRITDAQKINVHDRDWPGEAGYHGAQRPTVGGAEFCLEWEGTVEDVLELLEESGVDVEVGPVTRMCARGASTSVYFRDPDGNLVELTTYDEPARSRS